MADSNNSISTLIPQLLRLFNNSIEGFEKISEAVTGNKESVAIDLVDENEVLRRIFVPSFGFIKSELERLENNIKNVADVGTAQSTVRLPDGSFKKVILSKIKAEADDVTSLNSVEEFETKNNFFLESLLNPLMFVSFDITGQAPIDTERVVQKRFILDTDTQSKINFFDTNLKGRSDLGYQEFLETLLANNIGFIEDDDVIDVPPRDIRFTGSFSVIRISDIEVTEEINNVEVVSKRKSIKLNKLTYSDVRAGFPDTLNLKAGDFLVVNSNPKTTRYEIKSLDSSNNTVVLKLIEGFEQVTIGTDNLRFFSGIDDFVEVQINIGFNERNVVFMKPIDPDSKIPATNWSPGSAFYSNDLSITNENGSVENLESFYRNEVVDFGNFLLSMAKDNIPPSILGVLPEAPTLSATDFKVVQINQQITTNKSIDDIDQLQQEKVSLSSEIKELDNSIKRKREAIATKNFANDTERDSDKNELRALITERNSRTELFASIVKEIDSKSTDEDLLRAQPKYRIRGFFPIPDAKVTSETGEQQIVQFVVSSRYLNSEGAANAVEQIVFDDGGTERRGAFSSWTEKRSEVRERIFNDETGKYEWTESDVENADVININSVDIPLRKGEIAEIRIKSVSEAGWPSNPVTSDFSNVIRIEFPADLSTSDKVTEIVEENNKEFQRVRLQEELQAQGIDQHLASSFTANEKFFAHGSVDIASGFLSQEQTPITLFDKLVEINTKLQEFEEILKRVKGTLAVKMVDEAGNEILIKKNQINKFFAGYYSDIVADLNVKKGVIITKTFFLTLENIAATTLELISRIPGSSDRRVKVSENVGTSILPSRYPYYSNITPTDTFDGTDTDYNNNKKYDLVPILLVNPDNPDGEISSISPYQSSQVKSQFIYGRFKDVAAEEVFYSYEAPDTNGNASGTNVDVAIDGEYVYGRSTLGVSTTATDFIWGGQFDNSADIPLRDDDFDIGEDTIEVHIDHPFVKTPAAFESAYNGLVGSGSITAPFGGLWDTSVFAQQLFRQSKFAKLQSDTELGKKQNIFLFDDGSEAGSDFAATTLERTIKTSFGVDDQFLLGKKSCGAYTFLASDIHDNLIVDGKTALSLKEIETGSENAIRFPIIFQFRMTDYFGLGDTGIGNIGGDSSGATINITYAKQIGFDIFDSSDNTFSFDIEIFAKYKSDNLNVDKIPTRKIEVALDDLKRTLKGLAPSIVETRVDTARSSS